MKKTTLFIFIILFGLKTFAQVSGYSFSHTPEIYVPVTGFNSTAVGDDGSQNNIPIGFDFNFGNATYVSFSISTNGFIRLGNPISGSAFQNNFGNSILNTPLIAPFWDDNNRGTGTIQYNVMGTTPNRILEVGWNLVNISDGGRTNVNFSASFKLRLHENGQIEFIYGPMTSAAATSSASIGINDLTSFLSVTPSSDIPSVSGNIPNNTIASTVNIVGQKYSFTPQPPCVENLNPGNTVASEISVCSGRSFTLSLQNPFNGSQAAYQWQSSFNGTDFIDISGATSSSLIIAQTQATHYRCRVSCNETTIFTTPIAITMISAGQCFCMPTYTAGKTDGDLISNVVLTGTTLSNFSGIEEVNPAYTYFTGQPNYTATIQPGIPYDLAITCGRYNNQNISVWIDFNDDTVFTENERIGYSGQILQGETRIITILLPCNAVAGVHRMRIRDVHAVNAETIDPCNNYNYGETEDYDITVIDSTQCAVPIGLGTTAVNSTSAALTWEIGCGNNAWDLHFGLSRSGLPGETPSNPNLTSNNFIVQNLQPRTSYQFYVRALCGENENSEWSGPFVFTTGAPAALNDECANATVLTVGNTFETFEITSTNAGATKSIGAPEPTCSPFNFGGDVWFAATVPNSGSITLETRHLNGSQITDTVITLFSGSCEALNTLECDDEDGEDGFSKISYSGLTPGEIVYLRVWDYANDNVGAFRVSAWDASLGTNSFESGKFLYYPNPVKNVLTLSHAETISEVKIFNLLGQQVIAKPIQTNRAQIDMSGLPKGTYIAKVTVGRQIKTLKVIKE